MRVKHIKSKFNNDQLTCDEAIIKLMSNGYNEKEATEIVDCWFIDGFKEAVREKELEDNRL
jgi:hypothetical protein